MNRFSTHILMGLILTLLGTLCATDIPPGDSQWALILDKVLPGEKPLSVFLDLRAGKITAGLAKGLNSRIDAVDTSGLTLTGNRLAGSALVSLGADAYTTDGKALVCDLALDVTTDSAALKGTYKGHCGANTVQNTISGTMSALTDASAYRRFKVRFAGALARMYQAKTINWQYALDMDLSVVFQDGEFRSARFETPVPDYRRYSAMIQSSTFTLSGPHLSGTMTVNVNYGGQGKETKDIRAEVYEYTIDALVIGENVGGTFSAKVDTIAVKDYALKGSVSFGAPPSARQSFAFVRLHGGIKDDQPVLVNLSLSESDPIHGFAYCPSENHQVHAIDASKMKLVGDKLTGEFMVQVYPDIYRRDFQPFELRYSLDANITGAEISGRFSGEDRGVKTSGLVLGELRPRLKSLVSKIEDLRECQIGLGYALVGSLQPHEHKRGESANHVDVRLTFQNGRPMSASISSLKTPEAYTATFTGSDLKITGNRLTGWVEFTVASKIVSEGKYHYDLNAIISGQTFNGFWRGTHNGTTILTKSSKLAGKVIPLFPQ